MQEDIQNIQPNQSPELAELIRGNIDFQHSQNLKKTLFKESMIKISLDKDFQDLFDRQQDSLPSQEDCPPNFVEVSPEIKDICSWLEESEDFKGMAYVADKTLPRLLHILHQKVENTVLVVTEYHDYWLERMKQMARLFQIKWGFVNLQQGKDEKIKVLELYEMRKIKLLFISPSVFKHEEYLEFHCDLLVVTDLHLYLRSQQYLDHIVQQTNPGRVLCLYSSLMQESYKRSLEGLVSINEPDSTDSTCICLKTTAEQKYKTFMSYLQKNQLNRTLVIVKEKSEASGLSKKLKLMSLTSFNMLDQLTSQQMAQYSAPEILFRRMGQDRVLDAVEKSKSYSITISKYFDALRFGKFDCVVFFNFIDVPSFVEACPDAPHRVALLVDEDYFKIRNEITCDFIGSEQLAKVVMKVMEKPKKRQPNSMKRFYSDCIDDKLLHCYSVSKQFAEKDEEKVIRISWFCQAYDVTPRVFKKAIDALCKCGVILKECKLVYEIQIEDESLPRFRKMYPTATEIRRRVNLLNLSTTAQTTTSCILEQLRESTISYKVTEKALQLRIIQNYEDLNWNRLGELVNAETSQRAKDLDKSYGLYRECSYGSVELTRREKCLQRKKQILGFYTHNPDGGANLFESTHKSNLLCSEIQEWIRHSNDGQLDEHELVMLLQGVECGKIGRFKEEQIFGRYRRVKYEDLLKVVSKIYRNKRTKK